jgi:hypothetical protein
MAKAADIARLHAAPERAAEPNHVPPVAAPVATPVERKVRARLVVSSPEPEAHILTGAEITAIMKSHAPENRVSAIAALMRLRPTVMSS